MDPRWKKRQVVVVYRPQPIDYGPLLNIYRQEIQEQLDSGVAPEDLYKHLEDEEPVFLRGRKK